jgi:hypothetical protein
MNKPTSVAPPAGLAERVKQIAQSLRLHWDGLGGTRHEQLENGTSVWRMYDEWGDVGGSAVFDALSGDFLSIEETPSKREGPSVPLPDHLVPSDEELFAFTRSKLDAIGWTQLAELTAERVAGRAAWRVEWVMAGGTVAWADVRGRRGNLRIAQVGRR